MKIVLYLVLSCLSTKSSYQTESNCKKPADVMLLIDGSDSIGDEGWMKMKTFVKGLVGALNIGANVINMGVAVYSTKVGPVSDLQTKKTKSQLQNWLQNIKQPRDGTYTHLGIQYADEKLSTTGRENVPKIMVIVTEGISRNPQKTKSEAKIAKEKGIDIIAVNTGEIVYTKEVKDIASGPKNTFKAPFRALPSLITDVKNAICRDITLSYDAGDHLNTSIYGKHDDFNFSITNFPFMSSNVPSSPSYGEFKS